MGDLVAETAAVLAAPAPKVYALADVAKHATEADCWSIVNGTAYDLTKWVGLHPGGKATIAAMCGKDGSASFNAKHGRSNSAIGSLVAYALGAVVATPVVATTSPTFTLGQVAAHKRIGNCWTVVNGGVYNITKFTKTSRHGDLIAKAMCGRNASRAYAGHAAVAKLLPAKTLKKFRVGSLAAPAGRVGR